MSDNGASVETTCGACGAPTSPNQRHCTSCGVALVAAARSLAWIDRPCPKCRAAVVPTDIFCPHCGQRLAWNKRGEAVVDQRIPVSPAQRWIWKPRHVVILGILAIAVIAAVIADDEKPDPGTGASSASKVPRATATATLTATQRDAAYPLLPDVREIAIRPGNSIGKKMRFAGTMYSIHVARENDVYKLGDDQEKKYQVQMQVEVQAPNGSTEVLMIGYDGGTTGMFEGTPVLVYGTLVDTETFDNAFGGDVTQPLIAADLVQVN